MDVRSITHKGPRRLYEGNSSRGLNADTIDKLRKMALLKFMWVSKSAKRLPRALNAWVL